MLLSFSVVCQSEPLARDFFVEVEKNADFPDQNFFIKLNRQTLSGNPLDIVDTNGNVEPDSSSDDKRQRPHSQEIKTTFIELISSRWLYATNLLVAYELILTTRDASLYPNPNSYLTVEAVTTVVWLLKNYWNGNSPLFNPIEQQEASQNHRFAITAMMPGSEQDPPHYQPSESSDQHAPQAITHIRGYFTSLLFSDSADGNEDPDRQLHTVGLNCYIYPCNGVCQFRPSSDSSDSIVPDCEKSSTYDTEETSGESSCSHVANRYCYRYSPGDGIASDRIADSMGAGAAGTIGSGRQATCNVILVGEDGQLRQCQKVYKNQKTLSSHKADYHTGQKACDVTIVGVDDQPWPCGMVCQNANTLRYHKKSVHTGQQTCNVTMIGKDGQQRPCGKICKSVQALSNHKNLYHSGQQTCHVTVVDEDGQTRPCGLVCPNLRALLSHKTRCHTGQKTCVVMVIGKNGQPQPCGKVCKNAKALSAHKNSYHSGQRTCDVTVAGEDGQQPCGKVYKSYQNLRDHIRKDHTRQQICKETVIGKDGQQRPCGVVCKSASSLSSHKSSYHTGPKTCDVTLIGEDDRPRPCGKLFDNAKELSIHKRKDHSEPQTCDVTLVGEDGLQSPCGNVCKNAHELTRHKGIHRKRKLFDVNRNNDLPP